MRNHKVVKSFMLVTQLGISMMVPIFLCVPVGNFIDEKAGTGFFMPVFLFLGIAAAFRNVYYLLKPFYAGDKEREDEELAYFERLKEEGRQTALHRKQTAAEAEATAADGTLHGTGVRKRLSGKETKR